MPLAIEKAFAFDYQRRDPGGIIRINLPGKLDERVTLTPRRYL
jgi:hypothetical protein